MAVRPPVHASQSAAAALVAKGGMAGGGVAPPPGAPVEIAQPLQANAGAVVINDEHGRPQLITPQMLASQNERELAPLTYPKTTTTEPISREVVPASSRVVQAAGPVAPAGDAPRIILTDPAPIPAAPPDTTKLTRVSRGGFKGFGASTAAIRDENRARAEQKEQQRAVAKAGAPVVAASDVAAPSGPVDAVTAHLAQQPKPVLAAGGAGAQVAQVFRDRGNQAGNRGADPSRPAASNSDSPSRGIPRAIHDPGKQITGGFGDQADAQYFPLDGSEVLSMVWVIMDQLAQRLQNDLRFAVSTVYPRVEISAAVTIKGYAEDQAFTVEKIYPFANKTPEEIAILHGDSVIFVVREERREFNADETIASPPNAMRAEIGVTPPRKQFVGTGTARQLVDVPPQGDLA